MPISCGPIDSIDCASMPPGISAACVSAGRGRLLRGVARPPCRWPGPHAAACDGETGRVGRRRRRHERHQRARHPRRIGGIAVHHRGVLSPHAVVVGFGGRDRIAVAAEEIAWRSAWPDRTRFSSISGGGTTPAWAASNAIAACAGRDGGLLALRGHGQHPHHIRGRRHSHRHRRRPQP